MSKTITLNLKKDLIIEAVKTDTFLTGKIDKSVDAVKNAELAYNEQAGDDVYQERKLLRTLRSALAKFEANMAEFVDSSAGAISDNLSSSSDDIAITIAVSDRYFDGLANPLSSLAEEYIINMMDYTWWQPIKPELAKSYLAFAQESLMHVRMCLAKSAPKTSENDYNDVTGSIS